MEGDGVRKGGRKYGRGWDGGGMDGGDGVGRRWCEVDIDSS